MTVDQKAAQLRDKHGPWGSHDDYPREDWQREAYENDTSLGYWTWVAAQMEMRGGLEEEPSEYTVVGTNEHHPQGFTRVVSASSSEAAAEQYEGAHVIAVFEGAHDNHVYNLDL